MAVAEAVALAVERDDRVPVGGAVGEAAAEGTPVEDAVDVPTAEREAPPDRVPEAVTVAVAVPTPVEVAPPDRVPEEEAMAVAEAVGEAPPDRVPVEEALPVPTAVAERMEEADAVAEGVQEGSTGDPAGQAGVHTQGVHVEIEDAPSADEKEPAGHCVGFTEENGQ